MKKTTHAMILQSALEKTGAKDFVPQSIEKKLTRVLWMQWAQNFREDPTKTFAQTCEEFGTRLVEKYQVPLVHMTPRTVVMCKKYAV